METGLRSAAPPTRPCTLSILGNYDYLAIMLFTNKICLKVGYKCRYMYTDHEANSINDKSRVLSFHVTVSEPTDANRSFYTRWHAVKFSALLAPILNLQFQVAYHSIMNNGFASLPYKQRKQKNREELTLKRNRKNVRLFHKNLVKM